MIGVTQVLNKRDGVFTSDDERRLRAFAAQIAAALENAELFDEVLRLKNYNEGILKGHAQFGQEPAPRPRLSENDRQRRPATSARLTAPPGRVRRLVANPRHTGRERSCPDDAVAASGVKGERYKAARAQPNPAPSRFKGANTGRCPMIECCEPATKIRTNLP